MYWTPEIFKTEAVCELAVSRYGLALESVPVDIRSDLICLVAVANNGSALKYVSEAQKTLPNLCLVAVANDGTALEYASEAQKTLEICSVAVS
ncbi:DUF4116 domain-containing protein [Rhodoferax antarcticus]|uniref:DUF4116 domain-containing protein n=1 Tax=Rhodoferax antarcticus TaxID=81479 RepID=UPI0011153230|nr:DUF4116 domain-containing protein [Rhodoferax antarcticus]